MRNIQGEENVHFRMTKRNQLISLPGTLFLESQATTVLMTHDLPWSYIWIKALTKLKFAEINCMTNDLNASVQPRVIKKYFVYFSLSLLHNTNKIGVFFRSKYDHSYINNISRIRIYVTLSF